MTRHNAILVCLLTLSWSAFSADANGAGNPKTNVVFFLIDDLGWRDLGCYGSSYYRTPNIDRLAAEGMRFTDGYAACNVCLSGFPLSNKVLDNYFPFLNTDC